MNKNKKAFTLIELLVVVLIIAILAAVAVPQYQKAVFKSRVTQAISYVKAVRDAQELYYLNNGRYTNSESDLDIQVACPDTWQCGLINDPSTPVSTDAWASNSKKTFTVVYGYTYGRASTDPYASDVNGTLFCWGKKEDTMAANMCQSMGMPLGEDRNDGKVRHRIDY